jgi:hypothetical protein
VGRGNSPRFTGQLHLLRNIRTRALLSRISCNKKSGSFRYRLVPTLMLNWARLPRAAPENSKNLLAQIPDRREDLPWLIERNVC